MRVKLQLVICHDDGHEETVTDVITLNKHNQRIEHLGLTLAESKQLLSTLQRQLLQQQLNTFLDTRSTCPDCGCWSPRPATNSPAGSGDDSKSAPKFNSVRATFNSFSLVCS